MNIYSQELANVQLELEAAKKEIDELKARISVLSVGYGWSYNNPPDDDGKDLILEALPDEVKKALDKLLKAEQVATFEKTIRILGDAMFADLKGVPYSCYVISECRRQAELLKQSEVD